MQPYCRAGGACYPSQGPQASGREWRLRFHKGHGFLRQTCRANLLSAVRHILRTRAAERLTAPLPTQCCKNLNLDKCSLVCSSLIAQLRAQSQYFNKSWRPQLRDQTLCVSASDRCFFLKLQRRHGHDAELVERATPLRDLKLLAGSGGLDSTKGMDSLDRHVEQISFRNLLSAFSAVRHILQTSAAERLPAPLPTHCC